MTTDNSRSVIGLAADIFVDWSRTWNVRGHGKTVDKSWPWIERGISLDNSADAARTPRGLLRGRQPVCFVICGGDFTGNCHVTCEPLRQPWCGHPPALCETFPANCLDTARKLPGNCPDDSSDATRTAAWTAAVIAKPFANHRANFGANFGADIHRRFVRSFPPTARTRLGSCPEIARRLHRMLRGRCADVAPDVAPDATPDATPDVARKLRGCCSSCGLIF
jgi:hypothetical protein